MKAVPAVGPVAANPAVGAGPRAAHFLGHMGNRTTAEDVFNEDPSAARGQAGITVEHEDLLVLGCVWHHQPKRSSTIHDVTNVLTHDT